MASETGNPSEDNSVIVQIGTTADGQITAGVDDMLVLLKKRAREWFPEDCNFHRMFDHVVDETFWQVKGRPNQ